MNLIIGSNSLISKALQKDWDKKNIKYHLITRAKKNYTKNIYLDLSKLNKVELSKEYSTVIICASCTDLDVCENYPKKTHLVNVESIKKIINFYKDSKTQIILFSSNQVFDGEKPFREINDERNPLTEYGKQKKEIEDFALKFKNISIVRLTKVFSYQDSLFKSWKENLLKGKKIKVFSDYCISPLHIDILIKKINNLIVKRKSGISHFHGGYPDISYYDFAVSVANELQCSQELIQKTSYKDANFIYKLPRFTSLSED